MSISSHPGTVFGIEVYSEDSFDEISENAFLELQEEFSEDDDDYGWSDVIKHMKEKFYGDKNNWPEIYGVQTDFGNETYCYFLSNRPDVIHNFKEAKESEDPNWKENVLDEFLNRIGIMRSNFKTLSYLKDIEPETHMTPDFN